jgi:hypothetical protein
MRVRTLVASLSVLGILTTACANASTTDPGSGGTGGGGIDHPTGAADLLVRIGYEGGFVAPEWLLTQVPGFSLFGDGTALTQGAQTEIYPGPALPPLIATPVDAEGVQAILQAALDAGLDEDHEYTDMGSVGVADASTTVFTLTLDGTTHVTKAYALGILDTQPDGMSDQEYAARTRLLDFQNMVQDLRGSLPAGSVGDDAPFTPTGLRLFVSDYRPDPELKQTAVDWPLDTPLSSFGEPSTLDGTTCGAVTGADLEALLPLVQTANQLTPWRSQGTKYSILFRPLLPDESGC